MVICFIGHRTVADALQVKMRLTETVSKFIEDGADTFLFGSKSEFDTLCWEVVTEIKKQYPNIRRISYSTPNEIVFTSPKERLHFEQIFYRITNRKTHYKDYENTVHSQKSVNANKNVYIMRNQEMIDNSDICVFYYNKNYLPPRKKQSKRSVVSYQPQSGTSVAFIYAKRKKKTIINLFY